jgi:hypothetical protein
MHFAKGRICIDMEMQRHESTGRFDDVFEQLTKQINERSRSIHMNLNKQPTIDELAQLFAARKDSLDNHILWVCKEGEVHIDPLASGTPENDFGRSHPNMRTRLRMYRRGQGYVGKKAAADKVFMSRVLQTLKNEWIETRQETEVRVVDRLY